jgi:hypothetical protein
MILLAGADLVGSVLPQSPFQLTPPQPGGALLMGESRGTGVSLPVRGEAVGLPPRPFLYTLDQLAVILDLTETALAHHVYFEGRNTGVRRKDLMLARNIAPATEKPEWRVAEREFVRWMRTKGFKAYERTTFSH